MTEKTSSTELTYENAVRLLKELTEWHGFTGGWVAQCWLDARDFVELHREKENQENKSAPKTSAKP